MHSEWPAFQVERRQIGALKPYKHNARTHSKDQVAQLAKSIQEWGWTQPVLVDEADGVIAGHGRLQAAKSLGVSEVPVIVAKGWSEEQKRAYVLADNQLASNAGWDENLLRIEIGALGDAKFDVGLLGFSEEALANLFDTKSIVGDASPQLNGMNYAIVIRCSGEEDQTQLLDQLEKQGLKCEALIS